MKKLLFLCSIMLLVCIGLSFSANPIITSIYTADPATLVYNNRFYIFCGHDEASTSATNFYMRDWYILSSQNMVDWTNHGACLSVNDFSWTNADAWAGHNVYRNGKFWWYVPVNHSTIGWMSIGVASSTNVTGPYTDAKGSAIITDNTPNCSALNIDPAVFVDDDDQVYLYWGCYWDIRAVKLNSNMIDIIGTPVQPSGVTDFWEAPWLHKRNGTYYLSYAAGANPATTEYCTGSNPMGPWTYRGVVNGTTSSPTNHGAISEYMGQWYLTYHSADAPGGGEFRRSVCVDYLYYNGDGTIQQVIQTTTGVDPVGSTSPPTPTPTPSPPPAEGDNIAPNATASTSYCSSWETISALNDEVEPNDSSGTNPSGIDRYGNWDQTGTQWVEYQWGSNMSIDRSDVYWFDDNQGIDLPSAARLKYWNGSSYVTLTNIGTADHQYNAATFGTISTSRLRLEMDSNGTYSTGVLEWKVFLAGGATAPPTTAPPTTPPPTTPPPTTPPPTNPPGGNIAPNATPSTSYCSSWETVDALNDGYDPTDSNDESHPQYGNWPETGTQWVMYTWGSSQTINSTKVYWFDDPYGIDCPSSARVLYWNGSSYVQISTIGTSVDQYNTASFSAVNTTRLRLEFDSNGSQSTGILEWQVNN